MSSENVAQAQPQTGLVGSLTPEQSEILQKFKDALQQQGLFNAQRHDEYLLLRFLRARKFDLTRALEMITNCENWRKEKQVDQIYETFRFDEQQQVNTIYPRFYHQLDKHGRPLYVEMFGKLDLTELFKITSRERLEKFFIFEYERLLRVRLPAATKVAGYHVETSCTILDLKNCSVMQAVKIKDVLKLVVEIGQNYYPETMGMTFIINAPWLFDSIWSFVKMWIDKVTVDKIHIFKSGKDHTAVLFQYIDPVNLPFMLGGACQCDGGCENSDVGPWKNAPA